MVQPFQSESSPVTSNDTTHTPSQPKPRPTVPKDKTQSSQPQPTSNHKPSQPKSKPAVSKDKTQSSQPQPQLVTFDSKMKECHHLVKSIMTVRRQQNKENADTYKPKNRSPKKWIPMLGLCLSDKEILLSSTEWFKNNIINATQKLLKEPNPSMLGLQNVSCFLTMRFNVEPGEFNQILHDDSSHWLTVSTIGVKHQEVQAFDSLYPSTSTSTKMQIANLLYTKQPHIKISFKDIQMQSGLLLP